MATITIPAPATRQEVRAEAVHLYNNLDVKLPEDPSLITDELLIAKYGRITIDRMLEPQNDVGTQLGDRVRVPSHGPRLQDILNRTYTRPDGSTFTGRQALWDLAILTDHHKAEDFLAPPKPEPQPETEP